MRTMLVAPGVPNGTPATTMMRWPGTAKLRQNALASWIQPKRCGNWGWYFMVLKWLSENGLSLDVCGRLWDLVTPRSASRSAVVLARMGPPRSAWRGHWLGGTECLAMASLNSAVNRVALSLSATHQPTILRLKMSMMT